MHLNTPEQLFLSIARLLKHANCAKTHSGMKTAQKNAVLNILGELCSRKLGSYLYMLRQLVY